MKAKRWLTAIGAALAMGVSMNATAGLFGLGGTSWKEEVLLHDGSKIVVDRSTHRRGRHEIGQRPPIGEQSMSFTLPMSQRRIEWKDGFSEDVGGSNFNLMLLDIAGGIPYLVATPAGCLAYNKWGRPNPPYVIFKYLNDEWQRIPLGELPVEIRQPNLLNSSPDDVAEKRSNGGLVSAAAIREESEKSRVPHHKTILREPLKNAGGSCIKTDYYGKAGWLSPDWFSDQPSLNACLSFCDLKEIDTKDCPCSKFHKGEK